MWGESCAICKDPRYFSSWCPPRSLQSRATCRLWAAEWEQLHWGPACSPVRTAETITQGYSIVWNPNHLRNPNMSLLLADGSCRKTILLELGLWRISNVSSSFHLFFCFAILKNEQGLFQLHLHLLRAESSLSLCLWKAATEDFLLPVHMK